MNVSGTYHPHVLKRFRLGDPLGEGADMQVFAATDLESESPCVVKRPHPSLISRNIHEDVERRIALQSQLRSEGDALPSLPSLLACTAQDRFEWYFGDDLGHSYVVLVEERAAGVPLLGSVGDQVRGHPVSLPMNLFALHPSSEHLEREIENPSLSVLTIIERCLESGYLAGDLGPRNLFYSPGTGRATTIDLGALRRPRAEGKRSPAFDLNDILFEFFQFYTTPDRLPTSPEEYAQVRERRLVGSLERMTRSILEEYTSSSSGERRDSAEAILDDLARRRYQSVSEFRSGFELYLAQTASEPRSDTSDFAWSTALDRLREPYWSKYLFDAESELLQYG